MRFLIFMLTLIMSSALFAQKALPDFNQNPEWNILLTVWADQSLNQQSYISQVDTCGQTWIETTVNYWTADEQQAFIRVDGPRAYIKTTLDCGEPDLLMYDFSLSIGDTLFCAYGLLGVNVETNRPFLVMDRSLVTIGSEERIQLIVQDLGVNSNIGELTMIEGIGTLWQPFFSLYEYHAGTETYHELLCYYEQGTFIQDFNSFYDCFGTIVSTEEASQSALKVFPNPAREYLFVDSARPLTQCKVFSIHGQEVYGLQPLGDGSLDVSALAAGIYFLQIKHKDGSSQQVTFVKS